MAKKTALDRAIESLEGDKAVLQAAIDRLRQQQATSTTARVVRKPRARATTRPVMTLASSD